jgi:hypothetical protein
MLAPSQDVALALWLLAVQVHAVADDLFLSRRRLSGHTGNTDRTDANDHTDDSCGTSDSDSGSIPRASAATVPAILAARAKERDDARGARLDGERAGGTNARSEHLDGGERADARHLGENHVRPELMRKHCKNSAIAIPDVTPDQIRGMYALDRGGRALCDIFADGLY